MIVWRETSGLPRQLLLMKLNSRCSILFHLLVPGGKWQTDREMCFVGQRLQLGLPEAGAVAVGAAAVGGDRQAGGGRVAARAELEPPAADRLNGELGGVIVDSDVDPADIVGDVVDTVGGGLAQFGVAEVVGAYLLGLALATQLAPGVLEVADEFFLLGVDRDRRLPGLECRRDRLLMWRN